MWFTTYFGQTAPSSLTRVWLVIFALVATAPSVGLGQAAAVVDPPARLLEGGAGQAVSGAVQISNPTQGELNLRLYLSDWSLSATGDVEFAHLGSLPRSASEWITFAPTTLTLAPNETAEVAYEIDVPSDVEGGTYQSVLFAEGEPGEVEPGQMGAAMSLRVGHIMYVNVPPLEAAGRISGIFGQAPTSDDGSYTLIVQYLNEGNVVQRVSGALTVRGQEGTTVTSVDIPRAVILPQSERRFVIDLFGPFDAGNYTALVVLDFGDETQEIAGTYDFSLERPISAPDEP